MGCKTERMPQIVYPDLHVKGRIKCFAIHLILCFFKAASRGLDQCWLWWCGGGGVCKAVRVHCSVGKIQWILSLLVFSQYTYTMYNTSKECKECQELAKLCILRRKKHFTFIFLGWLSAGDRIVFHGWTVFIIANNILNLQWETTGYHLNIGVKKRQYNSLLFLVQNRQVFAPTKIAA
jgi:hypothetical protein